MGALAGLTVALLAGVNVSDASALNVNALALIGVGAIVGVALGFALRDLIIVLLTAIGGGGAIVVGLQTLLPQLNPAWAGWAAGITPFIVWAVIAVLGILVQYFIFRRRLTGNIIPG
jgi:hypothetical protein